ncbi:hypothetical protein VOLCADRAFT_63840 [Volvox carteri f. nagariensis]|uniref:D-2-hydroxyglutarate dehydrogenase n=1 Tax=Volvox carteri f. nagariensis TaxID=3068 RepID=D8U4H2_VOLCA|nr:uncharacterized protein VOLCADRAFT_63840 [Volvox carteri f. nagariensis]EFJ45502.1 hypothetical protein VOLCADRAFT_63840 [Volvox carteri f. nagariensis]|eukprot:XP_002953529.1 hypothetical protein VOLCADRAFT_63840 [Volvox carteri f. nagariensis]
MLARLGIARPSYVAVQRFLHAAIERNAAFDKVSEKDVAFFEQVLGSSGVISDPDALVPFNRDWQKKYVGNAKVALRPRTTQQVSELLRYCSSRRLAVVPQGGNTGLVGGSVPVFDEVVVSTAAMNRILHFDEVSGTLIAQSGAVLQALDEYAGQRGFMMPLDLGAKGSCHIGGNVSTNAGGLRLVRYGSLHGSVLGLEGSGGDGRVLDLLRTLRKDNTGFDLKQLFIGAEGTLGIITAVAIQCAPRPASVQLALLACPSFQAVTATLRAARRVLGEVLSAVEFLDQACSHLATRHLEGVRNPLVQQLQPLEGPQGGGEGGAGATHGSADAQSAPFYMLVETHGSDVDHDQQKMERFLESVMSEGHVTDGTLATSEAQAGAIWRLREGISEALVRRGAVYKYDVSLPTAVMYDLVEVMRSRLAAGGYGSDAGVLVVGYGHIGDGNLHLNISAPRYDDALLSLIEPFVYEYVSRHNGSISAEHGIGLMKAQCLSYSKGAVAVELMRRIKEVVDPVGIMNPYKVLPPR